MVNNLIMYDLEQVTDKFIKYIDDYGELFFFPPGATLQQIDKLYRDTIPEGLGTYFIQILHFYCFDSSFIKMIYYYTSALKIFMIC